MERHSSTSNGSSNTQRSSAPAENFPVPAARRRRVLPGEDAFPRNASPTPMSKTPVPGSQPRAGHATGVSDSKNNSNDKNQSGTASDTNANMVQALDLLLQRGNHLRDQMSHALSDPLARRMAEPNAGLADYHSQSLSATALDAFANGPDATRAVAAPFVMDSTRSIRSGTDNSPSAVHKVPLVVAELEGRRDRIGELVESILPDMRGLTGVNTADLVCVYAVQLNLHELNLSMPSAVMSQLQAALSKKNGGHLHQHHNHNHHGEKWHLCYQLPVTSPVGTVVTDTFSVPVNGSRLFECSGVGSSLNMRLDMDVTKVHPLLFDVPMAKAWAASEMTFELRLGRKVVCSGSVPLKQVLQAGHNNSSAVSGSMTQAGGAHSESPTALPNGTASPALVVPLVEAEEMRLQAQQSGNSRNSTVFSRRGGRGIAGYNSRKHSQGIMASVSLSFAMLKQRYALPSRVHEHAPEPATQRSRQQVSLPSQASSRSEPIVVKASDTNSKGPGKHPSSHPSRDLSLVPLFLQVYVGEVRTVPHQGEEQARASVPHTHLCVAYRPFVSRHVNPSNNFQFDQTINIQAQRGNEHAAFRVGEARRYECGFAQLSRAQRKHLAKEFMIFEFSTMPIPTADPKSPSIFLGLAKLPLKPLYKQLKAWMDQMRHSETSCPSLAPVRGRFIIEDPVTGARTGFAQLSVCLGTKQQLEQLALQGANQASFASASPNSSVFFTSHESMDLSRVADADTISTQPLASQARMNPPSLDFGGFDELILSIATRAPSFVPANLGEAFLKKNGHYVRYYFPAATADGDRSHSPPQGDLSHIWWDCDSSLSSKSKHALQQPWSKSARIEFQILSYEGPDPANGSERVVGTFSVSAHEIASAARSRNSHSAIHSNISWAKPRSLSRSIGGEHQLPRSVRLQVEFRRTERSTSTLVPRDNLCPVNSELHIRVHGVDLSWDNVMRAWDTVIEHQSGISEGARSSPSGGFLRFHFWDRSATTDDHGESSNAKLQQSNEWICHRTKLLSLQGLVESGFEVNIPLCVDVAFVQFVHSGSAHLKFELCLVTDENAPSEVEATESCPVVVGQCRFDLQTLLVSATGIQGIQRIQPISSATGQATGEQDDRSLGQIDADILLSRTSLRAGLKNSPASTTSVRIVQPPNAHHAVREVAKHSTLPTAHTDSNFAHDASQDSLRDGASALETVESLQAVIEEEWLQDDGEFGKILAAWQQDATVDTENGASRDLPVAAVDTGRDAPSKSPVAAAKSVHFADEQRQVGENVEKTIDIAAQQHATPERPVAGSRGHLFGELTAHATQQLLDLSLDAEQQVDKAHEQRQHQDPATGSDDGGMSSAATYGSGHGEPNGTQASASDSEDNAIELLIHQLLMKPSAAPRSRTLFYLVPGWVSRHGSGQDDLTTVTARVTSPTHMVCSGVAEVQKDEVNLRQAGRTGAPTRFPVPQSANLRRDALAMFVWTAVAPIEDHAGPTSRTEHDSAWAEGATLWGVATVDTFPLAKAGWGEIDGWYFVHHPGSARGSSFRDLLTEPLQLTLSSDVEHNEEASIGQLHVQVTAAEGSDLLSVSATFDESPTHSPSRRKANNASFQDSNTVSVSSIGSFDEHNAFSAHDYLQGFRHDMGFPEYSVESDTEKNVPTNGNALLSGVTSDNDDLEGNMSNEDLSEQLSQNLLELDSLMQRTLHLHADSDSEMSTGNCATDPTLPTDMQAVSEALRPQSLAENEVEGGEPASADLEFDRGGTASSSDTLTTSANGAVGGKNPTTAPHGSMFVQEDAERQRWEQDFHKLCFEDLDDDLHEDRDPNDDGTKPATPPAQSAKPRQSTDASTPLLDQETRRIVKILSPELEKTLSQRSPDRDVQFK
eukprot:INCI10435.2.p1 GENE.INCI10435.2~~INCI10435.2.p1  ORF type:complete len:1866 (-),score=299.21 INCI10435.2:44-5641(-)